MKLDSNLDTCLAHNTLGKAKPKYSWQYFTISIFLVVKSFMKNLLITKSTDCRSDLVKGHAFEAELSIYGVWLDLWNWYADRNPGVTVERAPQSRATTLGCISDPSHLIPHPHQQHQQLSDISTTACWCNAMTSISVLLSQQLLVTASWELMVFQFIILIDNIGSGSHLIIQYHLMLIASLY